MSDLWVPDTVKSFKCEVPDCGEEFLDEAKYVRHVAKCARKHRGRILEASEARAAEIDADPFQRIWDPEAHEWVMRRIARRRR